MAIAINSKSSIILRLKMHLLYKCPISLLIMSKQMRYFRILTDENIQKFVTTRDPIFTKMQNKGLLAEVKSKYT